MRACRRAVQALLAAWGLLGMPASGWAAPSSTLPLPIAGLNYELTFEDRFTSRATISAASAFDGAHWYNGTEQCCMSDSTGLPAVMYPTMIGGAIVDPYSISEGGGLGITLSKSGGAWHSGVLTSVDGKGVGFSQMYGYFEIRAKLPPGPGTWPAFWMLSRSNLVTHRDIGEIDIFEQYGHFPNGFCTTYHDWSAKTTPYYNCKNPTPDLTRDFHTWGLLWTASEMVVYFDDVEINRTATPGAMHQAYYLLVDLGLGGGWPTDRTPAVNVMQVAHVRAYAPR